MLCSGSPQGLPHRCDESCPEEEQQIAEEEPEDEQELRPTWCKRTLCCPECGALKDATGIQLRSKTSTSGYKTLWCTVGKHRSWANKWRCECGILWHTCTIHAVDPLQHLGPKITSAKPKMQECKHPQLPKQSLEAAANLIPGQHGNAGKVYKRKMGVQSEAVPMRGSNFNSIASDPKCPKLAAKIAAFRGHSAAA